MGRVDPLPLPATAFVEYQFIYLLISIFTRFASPTHFLSQITAGNAKGNVYKLWKGSPPPHNSSVTYIWVSNTILTINRW